MGILNVTPDSFSDGGRFDTIERAINHGVRLAAAGADLIDVGGESTRPGAGRVPVKQELARVLPVVRELAGAGLAVSVDTTRASVAESAIAAGACLVNDVSGGLADTAMGPCIAASNIPYIAMHWRAPSQTMQKYAQYNDVVLEVATELQMRRDSLCAAGVDESQIILDPGLGFAKTSAHNWTLLRNLDKLLALGQPIMIGASRKAFLGELLAEGSPRQSVAPPAERNGATATVSVLAAAAGASWVRVHDVTSTVDALRVAVKWAGVCDDQ